MNLTALQKRCLEVVHGNKLVQLTSVLQSVEVINSIYDRKAPDDPFVLGNSWAAVALYVVLEKRGQCDAFDMARRFGCLANRSERPKIWVTGGSIGQPETVAVGIALADPKRKVWLLTSDGCCFEGAFYEAMKLADERCRNLQIDVICNRWSAYRGVSFDEVLRAFGGRLNDRVTIHTVNETEYPRRLWGCSGHYARLTDEEYSELLA